MMQSLPSFFANNCIAVFVLNAKQKVEIDCQRWHFIKVVILQKGRTVFSEGYVTRSAMGVGFLCLS